MARKAEVHVIDDDDAVRDSLAFLFASAGMEVETYESPVTFLERCASLTGCVVTDVRMPEMSGLDLIKRMRALDSQLPVVVITGHGDVPLAVEAMKMGARDFLEKPFDDEALLGAVKLALASASNAADDEDDPARAKIAQLSQREREVLEGLVRGHANKVIAQELDISPRTVEVYRAKVMTKTGATSFAELVRMAMQAGIAPKDD